MGQKTLAREPLRDVAGSNNNRGAEFRSDLPEGQRRQPPLARLPEYPFHRDVGQQRRRPPVQQPKQSVQRSTVQVLALDEIQMEIGWRQEKYDCYPAMGTGRTSICIAQSPRRHSRLLPTSNRHGLPARTILSRQPMRKPSSASRPTQLGSPCNSAMSAHSPGPSNSSGSKCSAFKRFNLSTRYYQGASY